MGVAVSLRTSGFDLLERDRDIVSRRRISYQACFHPPNTKLP